MKIIIFTLRVLFCVPFFLIWSLIVIVQQFFSLIIEKILPDDFLDKEKEFMRKDIP